MAVAQTSDPLDLVVLGATGYIGGLVAAELARAAGPSLRFGLAGRDVGKLARARAALAAIDPRCADLPLVVVDTTDRAAVDRLAARARVVCSTVGPYARYGEHVVAACAERGIDYCDITGERAWIRRNIERHHDTAARSGARIVHACGFDSIPSDLGVLVVQARALARFGRACERVSAWFGPMRGRFGGGGYATALASLDELRRSPGLRAQLDDPYAFDPIPRQGGRDRGDQRGVRYERRIRAWTGPFVMAAINTRIVRRTHALLGYPWGREFQYREAASFGGGALGLLRALGVTAGGAAVALSTRAPGVTRVLRRLVPAPGEGPSASERARGHYEVCMVGEIDGVPAVHAWIRDRRDPGCGATACMLAQAALSLALDGPRGEGGILTPAACLGERLVDRLRAHGMRLDVEDDGDGTRP